MRKLFVDARILESDAGCDWIVDYDVHAGGGAGHDFTEHRFDRELQSKWQ